MAIDRRLRKTENALQSAFVDLVLEEGYESLKLTDVIAKADLNKSTFYLHYASLLSVSYAIEDKALAVLSDAFHNAEGNDLEKTLAVLNAIYKERKTLNALILVSDSHLYKKAEGSFKNFYFSLGVVTNDPNPSIKAAFLFGGAYGAIRNWILNGNRNDKEKLAKMICESLGTSDTK